MAKQEEMLIIKKAYDFSKWLLNHTGKFPKSHRFSVAVRLVLSPKMVLLFSKK